MNASVRDPWWKLIMALSIAALAISGWAYQTHATHRVERLIRESCERGNTIRANQRLVIGVVEVDVSPSQFAQLERARKNAAPVDCQHIND